MNASSEVLGDRFPRARGPPAAAGTPPGVVCCSCKELNWGSGAGRALSWETPCLIHAWSITSHSLSFLPLET